MGSTLERMRGIFPKWRDVTRVFEQAEILVHIKCSEAGCACQRMRRIGVTVPDGYQDLTNSEATQLLAGSGLAESMPG